MADLWLVGAALLGLFLGGAAWTMAALQVAVVGGGRVSDLGAGSVVRWLPLWGLGLDRDGSAFEHRRPPVRALCELVVAVYLVVIASRADDAGSFARIALLAAPLLVIAVIDWWTRVIYTNWIAVATAAAFVVASLGGLRSFLEALAAFAAGAAVFGAFYVLALLLYRDVRVVSLGAGDVWLAAAIGAMTGDVLAAVGTLFYGVLLAAVGAVVLLVLRRGTQLRALPSGAYLCAGALVGLALQVW